MYPAKFEYQRASSVDEALSLLAQHDDAKLLAGGHSLLPMMKLRLAQPATVIDIGRIDELRGISVDGDRVRIGSLTTHAEIAASDVLHQRCPLIAEAAAEIGDMQVRNRGTIGGNIAHADPGSDLPAVLCALDGQIHLRSQDGERTARAGDFFVDLLTTDLQENEVLMAVELPTLRSGTGAAYKKFEHPASGYAVVGAAAWVALGSDGSCTQAGLAINGVTATPLDGSAAAAALVGTKLDDAEIEGAIDTHVNTDDPLSDVFASGEYRLHVARVYAKRALQAARDRARA